MYMIGTTAGGVAGGIANETSIQTEQDFDQIGYGGSILGYGILLTGGFLNGEIVEVLISVDVGPPYSWQIWLDGTHPQDFWNSVRITNITGTAMDFVLLSVDADSFTQPGGILTIWEFNIAQIPMELNEQYLFQFFPAA